MHRLLIAVSIVAMAGPAAADQPDAGVDTCFASFAVAFDPPADCPVAFYAGAYDGPVNPRAYVYRSGVRVDVTGDVTIAPAVFEVTITSYDCRGNFANEMRNPYTYNEYKIPLVGVQLGEMVWIDNTAIGVVQPAGGECRGTASPYMKSCEHRATSCPGEDDHHDDGANHNAAGCVATSGVSSVLFGLALLAFTSRRRRN
jgi:hypothetical protein